LRHTTPYPHEDSYFFGLSCPYFVNGPMCFDVPHIVHFDVSVNFTLHFTQPKTYPATF